MGGHYRDPDIIAQVREMQDQIRRLQGSLLIEGDPVEWTVVPDACFNNDGSNGWFPAGTPDLAMYRRGGRVYFRGSVIYSAPPTGEAAAGILIDAPTGYGPEHDSQDVQFPIHTGDGTVDDTPGVHPHSTEDQWWRAEAIPTPTVGVGWIQLLPNPNFAGATNDPTGDLTGFAPHGTVLAFDPVSYVHE